MAKSALPTLAGTHPLSDLLFSPRAAFIWNHARKSVAWMNPAARAAFALCLDDFSASLTQTVIRRFGQCVQMQEGGCLKIRIGRGPALSCSVEILKLADGQDGLIVAELTDEDEPKAFLQAPANKAVRSPKKPVRKLARRPGKKARSAPKTTPTLTSDEMRAFKAVGRKVLRLCEEKRHSKERAPAPAPPTAPSTPLCVTASPEQAAQVLKTVMTAFDLVLYLGSAHEIVGVEGRPARLGWRKAKLAGKSIADTLLASDQAAFKRMLRKLATPASASCRDTLLIQGEDGNGMPCRAVLMPFEGRATHLLALLSLQLPARLRRPSSLANAAAMARLAA